MARVYTAVYAESWATVKVNAGAMKQPYYSRTGPPGFGSDAVDSDYPKIYRTDENKVTASAGPDGENVLDTHTGDWSDNGAAFYGFGTEEGKPSAPTSATGGFYNATAARARVSYKFNTSAWAAAQASYYPLFWNENILIAATFETGDPRPYFLINVDIAGWSSSLNVWVQSGGTGGDDSTARQFARATFENTWYEILIEWQCATIIGDWDDVAADGWLTMSLRNIATDTTEQIYSVSGLELFFQEYWEVPHHISRRAILGYAGQFGQSTNLVVETWADVEGLTGYFEWGTDPEALTNETEPQPIADGVEWVPFSELVTGLLPSTMYCFRAVRDDGTTLEYGDVLCFTTLGEQTFEDGAVSHPLTWITLTKRDGVKEPYAEVDLNDPPDYYDGYKRPRVERFLPIARGLSDRDGQIEHMSFGAVLSDIRTDRDDTDRPFRGMLADEVNKYLTNRPLEVWFVDDTERRRLGAPRLAAVGYVNDYAPVADLKFDVKGGDWLKKKFSRKRRAQQSWQPLISLADFPTCPVEKIKMAAPLIYGSLGLGGEDAVLGVTITVNPQPTAAPGSFALSLQAGGRTAGVRRYYIVTAIVGGMQSDWTPTLEETTTNTNRTIRVSWAAVTGATAYYVYSSHRPDFLQYYYLTVGAGVTSYDDDTTPIAEANRVGTDWNMGQRINLSYNVWAKVGGGLFSIPGGAGTVITPVPNRHFNADLFDRDIDVSWTAHPGAVDGYRIVRRRSYYSEWDPVFDRQWDVAAGVLTITDDLITVTAVTVPAGELIAVAAAGQAEANFVGIGAYGTVPITVSALLVARHACARLGNIYIPTTTDGVDGETETTYAAVPDDQYGVTWFAPDHAGWIYPNKYVDINGRRYTLIFTTVEPVPDKVLVDVDGIESAADGTGTLIRSIVDQRLHFMTNFIAPDTPWQSGPYLTAADTVFPHVADLPVVDDVSHAEVKAALAARLEGAGDYEGAVIIGAAGEFVTAADALAWFQVSGDFDQAFNRKGQDTISCEPISPVEPAAEITDVLSIREGSLSLVDQVTSAFFNILPYVHSRDYTGREHSGWYGNAEARAEDSITNYDQERESPKFELHACRANTPAGAATIADVMARKLARYQDPRRTGVLTMGFEGLSYEPGISVLITSVDGIGPDGWIGREVRLTRHEVDPTAGTVKLDFYDLTAVLANHETFRRRRLR